MQYLLSEEEYDALLKLRKEQKQLPSIENLQKFCTFVADHMPVQSGWYKGKPWGCIITRKEEWYCDDCPAEKICPYNGKEWSK